MRYALMPILVAVLLVAAGCSSQRDGGSAGEDAEAGGVFAERDYITLTTSDGFILGATYFAPTAESGRGLVLVHMLGADSSTWSSFAEIAQRRGYHVLTFDLRGHGTSLTQGAASRHWRGFTDEDFMSATLDIDAAVNALEEKGLSSRNISVIGASIGANLAARYASDHDVAAIALLSPGLAYHGVTTDDAVPSIGEPALIIAAEGDTYSAESSRTLAGLGAGAAIELLVLGGEAHGTNLLREQPGLQHRILDWIEQER